MEHSKIWFGRRSAADRRRARASLLLSWRYRRRRRIRRASDRVKIVFLDCFSPGLLVLLFITLSLSLLDAFLTLLLMNHGAVELNPLMAFLLDAGMHAFISVKYTLTALSATILVVFHYYFMKLLGLQVRDVLKCLAGFFVLVIVWELYLIARHVL